MISIYIFLHLDRSPIAAEAGTDAAKDIVESAGHFRFRWRHLPVGAGSTGAVGGDGKGAVALRRRRRRGGVQFAFAVKILKVC